MARIRTIKPQHVTDKELPKISLQAHLFWVLSWCFSDDEGVIENDPLLLKSQMFPRRKDVKIEHIEQWIDQLILSKFVIPFTYEGENYLIQRTFKIHQKIDRPQVSKIPDDTIRRILDECSTTQQPCIVKECNSIVKDSSVSENEFIFFSDNVKLKTSEDKQLEIDIGVDTKNRCYQYLSNYKKEKGYKTKSDYLTIKRWVIEAVNKTQHNGNTEKHYQQSNTGKQLLDSNGGFGKL